MRLRVVVAALVLLTACGGGTSGSEPTFGTGSGRSVDVGTDELVAQKASTDIVNCPATGSGAETVADGLPAGSLPCLGGGRLVDLSQLRGTPLVLNLWANYCGPCREEMPLFEKLHEEAGNRLLVLGLDFQDLQPDRALALASETGVSYPLVADPDASTKTALQVIGLPQTMFIDADGHVVANVRGAVATYSDLTDLVAEHLRVTW